MKVMSRWMSQRTSKKLAALAGGICIAMLARSAISQDRFFVHNGPPEEGQGIEGYSYISLDGKVTIDPQLLYRQITEGDPVHAAGMPSDTSAISLELRFDYTAPSGDEFPFEIVLPVESPKVHSDGFAKGYYRDMRFVFTWEQMANEQNYRLWDTPARIIVPNVHKIPVYMYAGALNTPFYDPVGSPSNRYFDFIRLRNHFHEKLEEDVGRIATDANVNIPNNPGCSGWYQFRFFGYLDHDWLKDGINEDGELAKLPPGITLVPSITECGDKSDETFGFPGCATLNGTRIAIEASVLNDGISPEAVITLHEIGHTKGLDHEQMEEQNIMHTPSQDDNLEIRKDQCPNFSVGKQYVSPDPWEE